MLQLKIDDVQEVIAQQRMIWIQPIVVMARLFDYAWFSPKSGFRYSESHGQNLSGRSSA
jgi:hypothetical protein